MTERFGKYLLYAIGEILLIMAGILLAMNLNNWNEDRKETVIAKQTLLEIRNQTSFRSQIIYSYFSNVKQMRNALRRLNNENLTDSIQVVKTIVDATSSELISFSSVENSMVDVKTAMNLPDDMNHLSEMINYYKVNSNILDELIHLLNEKAAQNKKEIFDEAQFLLDNSENSFRRQLELIQQNIKIQNNSLKQKKVLSKILLNIETLNLVNYGLGFNIDYLLKRDGDYDIDSVLQRSGFELLETTTDTIKVLEGDSLIHYKEQFTTEKVLPTIVFNHSDRIYNYDSSNFATILNPNTFIPIIGLKEDVIELTDQESGEVLRYKIRYDGYLILR